MSARVSRSIAGAVVVGGIAVLVASAVGDDSDSAAEVDASPTEVVDATTTSVAGRDEAADETDTAEAEAADETDTAEETGAAAPAADEAEDIPDLGAVGTLEDIPDLGAVGTLEDIPDLGAVGTLEDIDGWMNTDATSLEEILTANEVTVVQFWTFGCHNCRATLPHLQELYADFAGAGLEIVGVHAPEFDHEAEPDNIARALVDLDVTWPVALDTDKRNFHRWQPGNTGYWPRTYVIDGDGRIRFDHIGEGRYDELRATVAGLLAA